MNLYADGKGSNNAEHIVMQLQSSNNETLYKAELITGRPASDYTIRIIANYENIAVPLENNYIVWQR